MMNSINDINVPVVGGSPEQQPQQQTVPKQAKKNDDPKTMFPWLLHSLLEEAEKDGLGHVVSWLPCGQRFQVFRREAFMEEILPKYFRQTRYKSFVRQLNLWGFRCINSGADKGAYIHEQFVRHDPELCLSMDRIKIKGQKGNKSASKKKSRTRPAAPRCVSPRRPSPEAARVSVSIPDINTTNNTINSSNAINDFTPPLLPNLCDDFMSVTTPGIAALAASQNQNDGNGNHVDQEGWTSQASPEAQRQFHNEHFRNQRSVPMPAHRSSMTWARSLFNEDPVLNQMAEELADDPSSSFDWMDALMVEDIESVSGEADNSNNNFHGNNQVNDDPWMSGVRSVTAVNRRTLARSVSSVNYPSTSSESFWSMPSTQ